MADVFISHESTERDSPVALERALVGAGFSVWWDRELLPGRSYQEAIVDQLNAAAAVVVVWSSGSVRSDWVYSEARRAHDQGKLVQVRAETVLIDQLPAPFDAFYCPPVSDVDAVLRAVRTLTDALGDTSEAAVIRGALSPVVIPPRRSVTLLRAEVESSAQQVHILGETWLAALTQQRGICRMVWDHWRGQELPADPDTAFVAFASAADACGAAIALQRGLLDAEWQDGAKVEMRIGVHTGSPQQHGDGYVGMDVERTLRIAAAAHPGQILLSEATAHLVAPDLAPGKQPRSLGEHQLKNVPGRLRLFQVLAPGLATDFPEPRTLGAAVSLPEVLGPILGRDGELVELSNLLAEGRRLLTLTGPGGTGKTRLAIALAALTAESFADGAYFVPLVTADAEEQVWPAIADVMELPAAGHVPPGIFDLLARREAVLVLDNLEQVAGADNAVRDMLSRAPRLRIVGTSRRPLHVAGEFEHQVPPLLLPADRSFKSILESGAVQLFLEHARRVRRGFELTAGNADAIARLCAGLDGLPLAIELVAARIKVFTPEAMVTRLDQVLDVASSDRSRSKRQRTIRGAIAWSYELLSLDQQFVLRALSVFDGGASLAGTIAVAQGGRLSDDQIVEAAFELVDASLVRVEDQEDGEPRFQLLETVKRYGLDQAHACGEFDFFVELHAKFFYDLARESRIAQGSSQYARRRGAFLTELPNFRSLLSRAADNLRHPEFYGADNVPASHVYALLCQLAMDYRRPSEAVAWAQACQALPDPDLAGLARALQVHGASCVYTRAERQSQSLLEAALETSTRVIAGRPLPIGVDVKLTKFNALVYLTQVTAYLGDTGRAEAVCDELMTMSESMSASGRARALEAAYVLAEAQGDFERGGRLLTQEGELRASLQDRQAFLIWTNNMADHETRVGNRSRAFELIVQQLDAVIALADPALLVYAAETLATAIGPQYPRESARLIGAAEEHRLIEGLPKATYEDELDELLMAPIRALIPGAEWVDNVRLGRAMNLADIMRQMVELSISNDVADD